MKKLIISALALLLGLYYAIGTEDWVLLNEPFLEEIYLHQKSGRIPKDSFRISRIERDVNGKWSITLSNKDGNIVSAFSSTNYAEYPIVYLSPVNSEVYGYVKVNWNAISKSSIVESPNDSGHDATCFDPKNAPEINKFINSNVLYVSSSEGKYGNLGLSPEYPVPSIASVLPLKKKKKIKLKSGDVFYENINCLDADASLCSYGEGTKPTLSGWKIINKKSNVWQEGKIENGVWKKEKGTHIWRIDLESDNFEGRLSSKSKYHNNIGLIVNRQTRETYGKKVEFMYKSECNDPYHSEQHNNFLEHEFDFFQTSKSKNVTSEDYRYLYVYSEKAPSTLDLMFSTYGSGVVMNNSSIDNIQIEGFSCHGIGAGSNVKITNCDISHIGGAQHLSNSVWTRYGNGIEFYLASNRENGHVAYNKISKVFDCGLTIQGNSSKTLMAKNIIMEQNIIDSCRQSFEFFLNDGDLQNKNDCKGCYFRNNLCMNAGENGFRAPEKRDLHLLSYQKDHKSTMIIENNVFFGGKGFYSAMYPNMLTFGEGNIYYFMENPILWNQGFRGNMSIVYGSNGTMKNEIRKNCSVIGSIKMIPCSSSDYYKYLSESKKQYIKR